MRWPAISRFGLASIASVACWSSKPQQPTTIDNRTDPLAQRDDGTAYLCSISDGGYSYPQFPCVIREVDGRMMLAKLGGSQRFRGVVQKQGEGFTFEGEFFCPWGDCTQPMHGVFEPTGDGGLRGSFTDISIVVTMVRAPANAAWGGATYGGDGYGGFGYGGWGYGGASYGNPVKHRNRRH